MIDASRIREGDRVLAALGNDVHAEGIVDMVTQEGNYVRIVWPVKRPDILSKQSPLWRILEKEL